ncbi:helix-turn-helix transcriptional regulator [Cohnella faecalis]|uniref:YafY family transcriptional regulator n=1 Tax=Cohnella faecalis TaxID=2315694 RepID=A0A398CK11_9BACL|nr:YafY family protein [Cohnella faecalis]RIE01198.1 YafY family transcriptional regulator [Cohnella faecalis]
MRLERLLNIVIILINHRMVQAKELAERFEVSVRTIYRDIEALGLAGIPVVTHQGSNGGIGLAEGYRLDRHLLTDQECAAIVTALRSITSFAAGDGADSAMLMEKIRSIIPAVRQQAFQEQSSQLLVDLSPWGHYPQLEAMLSTVKRSISNQRLLRFQYHNAKGEVSERLVEPYTLLMKGRSWYLYAYCRQRNDYRLFKLQRMKDTVITEAAFTRRADAETDNPTLVVKQWYTPENTTDVVLRFTDQARHLAEEWFGISSLESETVGEVRKWRATARFPEDSWLYGFILSFGSEVEVLEPAHIRNIIRQSAQRVADIYSGDL